MQEIWRSNAIWVHKAKNNPGSCPGAQQQQWQQQQCMKRTGRLVWGSMVCARVGFCCGGWTEGRQENMRAGTEWQGGANSYNNSSFSSVVHHYKWTQWIWHSTKMTMILVLIIIPLCIFLVDWSFMHMRVLSFLYSSCYKSIKKKLPSQVRQISSFFP